MTSGARRQARARHPCTRWPFDLRRMEQRVSEDLAGEGHPWPGRAAALLALRGRLGVDRAGFAVLVGVPEDVVAAIEDGRRLGAVVDGP